MALLTPCTQRGSETKPRVAEQVEIDAKYSGYITRQQDEVDRLQRHEKHGHTSGL